MTVAGSHQAAQHPLLLYSAAAAAAAAGHYASVPSFCNQSLIYGISPNANGAPVGGNNNASPGTPAADKEASKNSSIADLRMKAKKHAESLLGVGVGGADGRPDVASSAPEDPHADVN
jgi:hypothetical protein